MLFSSKARRRQQNRSAGSTSQIAAIEMLERRTLLSATAVGLETPVNTSTVGIQTVGAADGRSVAVAADNSYVTVWSSS